MYRHARASSIIGQRTWTCAAAGTGECICPLRLTESRFVQCPHRTVTMLSMLFPGTLTCTQTNIPRINQWLTNHMLESRAYVNPSKKDKRMGEETKDQGGSEKACDWISDQVYVKPSLLSSHFVCTFLL